MQLPRKPNGGDPHPLSNFFRFQHVWNDVSTDIEWWALSGLYLICERATYTKLPRFWSGPCVLGTIHPFFFLLPLARR
jgi:hypothetical protein